MDETHEIPCDSCVRPPSSACPAGFEFAILRFQFHQRSSPRWGSRFVVFLRSVFLWSSLGSVCPFTGKAHIESRRLLEIDCGQERRAADLFLRLLCLDQRGWPVRATDRDMSPIGLFIY